MDTYRIVRMYQRLGMSNRIIKRDLSLEEAKNHCQNPETSSSTCTKYHGKKRTEWYGPWFDSYESET